MGINDLVAYAFLNTELAEVEKDNGEKKLALALYLGGEAPTQEEVQEIERAVNEMFIITLKELKSELYVNEGYLIMTTEKELPAFMMSLQLFSWICAGILLQRFFEGNIHAVFETLALSMKKHVIDYILLHTTGRREGMLNERI